MKHGIKNMAALLAFLAFTAVAALTVDAQSAHRIDSSDLLESRPVYAPRSATFGATMGLITADADRFMSVLDFGSLSAQNWFAYAGVDENIKDGINIGFGTRLGADGKNYFGVAYSGGLITELAGLFTNQSPIAFKLVTEEDSAGTTKPHLEDGKGDKVGAGEYISNHNLHFLFGMGVFGIKLGFAEYIRGIVAGAENNLETSLKPSIEFGLNVGGFKAALRGAVDFHQNAGDTYKEGITPTPTPALWYTTETREINFLEPSGGITLGLNFSKSEKTLAELDLIADGVFRIYGLKGDLPKTDWTVNGSASDKYEASEITDLRVTGSLGFTYRRELNEKFTLGFNAKVGGGFVLLSISQKDNATKEYDDTYTHLYVTPDVSAGVTYSPWKDHFALHGGLGLQLFSIEQTDEDIPDGSTPDPSRTTTNVEIPTVRLAIGTTVNFTENTALDLLIAARNITELTNTKFTMLFSVKK
ncbi:hypothetical protein FACS1894130_11330 [Spirochaetia bacterium]|nr:hypothetical protein FACS1894130_11330 [Spirochaetia bacterium]